MRLLVALLVVVVALATPRRAFASTVSYRPPVDGPVTDPFRAPPQPWLAGNRGLEYGTAPNTPVRAAADGVVTFAGDVAGALHVVVLHGDGIRTSYSFLASVAVHRGDHVVQGQFVGVTRDRLHFGARAGDTYIDPASLFAAGPPSVHLVPDDERGPGSEAKERSGLASMLSRLPRFANAVTGTAADWLARAPVPGPPAISARVITTAATALDPFSHSVALLGAVRTWASQRGRCTAEGTPLPVRPGDHHLAVLVGGLGSSTDNAAVFGVKTDDLGYGAGDVFRFSYAGGTTADQPYDPADTTQDIRLSGRRLRALLERLGREHPGMPVDIIAHSQGGLVARAALSTADPSDRRMPPVANVITLGSPHEGAALATVGRNLRSGAPGYEALTLAHVAAPDAIDPRSTSVAQLAEDSHLLDELGRRRFPHGVRVTSIAARGDLLVTGDSTALPGAARTTVSAGGVPWKEHDALPGSAAAQREIALAVAGLLPTCRRLADALVDAAVGEVVDGGEHGLALVAAAPAAAVPIPRKDP